MSQMSRALAAVSAFFIFTGASSCRNGSTTPQPITLASISIHQVTPFTGLGQQTLFVATATMNNGNTEPIAAPSWQSSNPAVVKIDASGLATSVAEGNATITATHQSISASADVTVLIQWSVKGRLISTADGSPVTSGATISAAAAQSISFSSDGSYALTGLGAPAGVPVTISGPAFVTRSTTLAVSGARSGVDVDLISLASPFSLTFYREMIRGSADNNGLLQQNFRWELSPNFYINTRNGSSTMAPGVIADLVATIPALVAQVSNGALTAQRIETGTDTRPITPGWINIEYTTAIGSCGLGSIGGNVARINPICSDLTFVGLHEITHTLGFWHHTQFGGLMSRVGPDTRSRGLNAAEAFHTKIAFARPRGNRDPDADPQSRLLSLPAADAGRTLACWPIR